jgi:hypothetical protein
LVEAGDETKLNRIAAGREDDGYGLGRFRCNDIRRRACCGNHGNATTNQIGRHFRQLLVVAFCPSVLDRDVAALVVTGLAQPSAKCRQEEAISLQRSAVEESNHRYRRLLRRAPRAAKLPPLRQQAR